MENMEKIIWKKVYYAINNLHFENMLQIICNDMMYLIIKIININLVSL